MSTLDNNTAHSAAASAGQVHSDPMIEIVCDSCATSYAVSVRHFADKYYRTFPCSACGSSWTEYLDDEVYEHVKDAVRHLLPSPAEVLPEADVATDVADISATSVATFDEAEKSDTNFGNLPEQEDYSLDNEGLAVSAAESVSNDESVDDILAAAEETILAAGDTPEGEDSYAKGDADGEDVGDSDQVEKNIENNELSDTEDSQDADVAANTEHDESQATTSRKKKTNKEENQDDDEPKPWYVRYINPSTWGNFSLVPLSIGSGLVVLIFLFSFLYVYLFRYDIINENPVAIGIYQKAGIVISPVEGLSVKIANINREAVIIPGEQTRYDFDINASVINLGEIERRLPFLRVYLIDDLGSTIDFWDLDLTSRVLSVEEEITITTQLPQQYSGDDNIESIEMRLITQQERQILGINKDIQTQTITG